MSVMTAGSDSHYRMLSDLRAMEAVRTFCRMLYRMEGPPAEAIAALIEENQIQRANH
jgi:polyketide synthase PksR